MNRQSDAWELFFSAIIPLLVVLAIIALIMVAPSIDEILRRY
jgi:hypothetical protein